jgi:hypothetical protein
MKQVDRQALELAMEQARREPDIAAQLDDKLQGTKLEDGKGWAYKPECWQDVAKFAAYRCQNTLAAIAALANSAMRERRRWRRAARRSFAQDARGAP